MESDIVSIHANYTLDNENMINHRLLSLMKKSAIFINTARGELVNEEDLANCLIGNEIAGVAVDVLADEQQKRENNTLVKIAKMYPERMIITPHIGGATVDSMKKTEIFIAEKFIKVAKKDIE